MTRQSPSKAHEAATAAQDLEPTAHAYDAPGLSPKQFLLRVMHAPDAAIRDRLRAASELLRLYPRDWDPPAFTYRIGGILECHSLSQSEALEPEVETTEINSQKRESSRETLNHSGEPKAPANIETIIEDIKSGNFPQPTRCTICGEYMPYPCSTSKTPIN